MILIFAVIFFINFVSNLGHYNIEEIEFVTYDINFSKDSKNAQFDEKPTQLIVLSKFGKRFTCAIPELKVYKPDYIRNVTAFSQNITSVLKPLAKRPCLKLDKGWWTYEFCYKRHIHQYHLQDGKVRGMETYLGAYSHDYNWTSEMISSRKNSDENYHVQYYNNGTYCGASKMPREATVKFYCTTKSDYISDIEEYQPCSYMLHVHTKHLCKVPFFNKKDGQLSYNINCQSEKSFIESEANILKNELEKDVQEESIAQDEMGLSGGKVEEKTKAVQDLVGVDLENSDEGKIGKNSYKIVFNKEAFDENDDKRSLVKLLLADLFNGDNRREKKRYSEFHDEYFSHVNKKSKAKKNKKDLIIF